MQSLKLMIELTLFRLQYMKSDLKEKEKETKNEEKEYVEDKKHHEALQNELANLAKAMEKIGYKEGHMENLQKKRYTCINKNSLMYFCTCKSDIAVPLVRTTYRPPSLLIG